MKTLKINKNYSAKLSWIPTSTDWVEEAQEWDGQWFYEIYHKGKKIGEAAFLEREDSSIIVPCDFCDLAIEIQKPHQRKGIGSFLLQHIQDHPSSVLV